MSLLESRRASYIAAQAQAARKGVQNKEPESASADASDPMAAIERENNASRAPPAGGAAPSFVKSVQSNVTFKDDDAEVGGAVVNPDAIAMDDMEDDSDDDE
jgi:hypothetical protein